jgi:hypothetical protein
MEKAVSRRHMENGMRCLSALAGSVLLAVSAVGPAGAVTVPVAGKIVLQPGMTLVKCIQRNWHGGCDKYDVPPGPPKQDCARSTHWVCVEQDRSGRCKKYECS